MPTPPPPTSKFSLNDFTNFVKNLDEEYQTYLLLMIIIIIVLIYLAYLAYIFSLQSRECDYMNNLYPTIDGYLSSIPNYTEDFSACLVDYYVKTAYNACSGGNYKNGWVDVCNLKAVIKQGARCLDFEIYSLDDTPVVATSIDSSFFIKETYNSVEFGKVMSIIDGYSFSTGTSPNPTDPLIIHLRIKSTNQVIYTKLAELFRSYSRMLGYEYSYINTTNTNLGLKKLSTFQNKIILVVDGTNKAYLENEDFLEYVNMVSNGYYMRLYRYYDIKNNPDITELTEYNKQNLSLVIPDNEMNPHNPSGGLSRIYGCQFVAMRFQQVDNYLLENTEFFDRAGYAFVLKPPELRYAPLTINVRPPQKEEYSYETREVKSDYMPAQLI